MAKPATRVTFRPRDRSNVRSPKGNPRDIVRWTLKIHKLERASRMVSSSDYTGEVELARSGTGGQILSLNLHDRSAVHHVRHIVGFTKSVEREDTARFRRVAK